MAGAEGGDRSFNPRAHQLKLSLNLTAPIDANRSLGELQSVAQEIQRQKNEVLCQLKYEDKDRHSYFSQLEHLARQMRELPLPTDSPSMEYELERKRLELETQRMQETMLKTLGTTSEVVRRREERISLLRKLDTQLTEIESLIASKNQAAAEAAAAADIWLSGSSLELHLEEKNGIHSDTASVMSFTSSIHSSGGATQSKQQQQPSQQANMAPVAAAVAGPKVEVVYNLLTMLFSHDRQNVSQKLLLMSTSPETRNTLHQVGCIPLLVQLIYNQDGDSGSSFQQMQGSDQSASSSSQQHWILSSAEKESRSSAAQALHNLVYSGGDERKVKREVRILKLLDLVRGYADGLREAIVTRHPNTDDLLIDHCHDHPLLPDDDPEVHPCGVVTNLMKLSFDEDHRHAMSQLGALQGLCEVLHMDQLAHGPLSEDQQCTTLRRYASMTLTNLTFGHGPNKALLCSTRPLLAVLSLQLRSPNDDLRQVTASVLRNLSWRADGPSKEALQKSSVVASLIAVAMETHRESTLKSMLSALWNLSSHSSNNKAAICSAPGALEFLVRTLNYKSESKTLSVVESGGGVLRNVSSHIATRSDYRAVLRQNGCFNILLHQLRSPSLTVVSNACGTLWNLSARCPQDQTLLRELGAVPMLRSLIHSRHKMIAQASQAALKNLEASAVNGGGGSNLPSPLTGHPSPSPQSQSSSSSLQARKQKALEQEIDQTLTEMCDHMDPLSPLDDQPNPFDRSRMYRSLGGHNNAVYGRSRSSLAPPTSLALAGNRQQRSSSLERNKQQLQQPQPLTPTVPSPSSRLQASRTAWRSHETNEISYTSLNYEEDDQPVNYSLKYTEVVKTAASSSSTAQVVSRSVSKSAVGQIESSEVTTTVKKALVLSAYRETDLEEPTEQPTDFSLRYGDPDDEDEEDYDASDTMQTWNVEGTPYETPFTRSSAASLTDLREAGKPPSNKPIKREEEEEEEDQEGGQTPPPRGSSKTVTFNEESSNGGGVGTSNSTVNFAEQTPLMFSRSSSMASLDSLDQLDGQGNSHQQHDEGSVLSEFSRLTSRAVSPSDLPDSPGQTMPSSPRHPRPSNGKKPLTPPLREQQQQPDTTATKQQQQPDVFEDTTNAFGMEEGQTPAFGTRAASPLSQLSFDDEPSSPSPAPPPPPPAVTAAAAPPVLAGSRAQMPLPVNSPAAPSLQMPLVRPDLNRVVKSTSEVNFRNHFDYDESRHFNEEDSPALTRCTSLSSLHIDGEVISTAKKILRREEEQPMVTASTERKTVDPPVLAKAAVPVHQQQQPPLVHSAEWSEDESGSEDDLLLEDIITLGRQPAGAKAKTGSQQKQQQPPPPPQRTSSTSLSKSASAHSLQLASSSSTAAATAPCAVPVSRSNIDFTSTTAGASESVEASDDDDEMLYACIKSAKPKAKPVPPPRTSSIKSSSSSSLSSITQQQQQQRSRQPMPLPNSSSRPPTAPTSRDPLRVPPLHGPYANVRQMATIQQQQQQQRHNTRSSSEVRSSASSSNGPSANGVVSGRRSRHSSQGSSRLGASGCSNNTSSNGGIQGSATAAVVNGTPGRGEVDYRYSYKVEDTPVTFSRNSSLSSLSVNSNDDEPSAEDQALLDSCIVWGMPPKSSKQSAPPQQQQQKKQPQQQQEQQQSESKNCWAGAGVRRAGDGQAASATSSAASTSSVTTGKSGTSSVIDLTDVVVKMEEPSVPESDPAPVLPLPEQLEGYPSMTHSSLIRLEANQVAAQIAAGQQQQQLQQSASSYFPCSNNLNDLNGDPYSSLLSPSFIDVATSSWPAGSPTPSRKSSQQQQQLQQPASPLLKRALSSSLGQSSLSESSSLMMTCSVLDPNYFDDEQRRQGLLGQLAAMERLAIDENANSSPATTPPPPVKGDHTENSTGNNSSNASPQTERRKLTPRDRRQADKDRYQTYTLNANPSTANNDAKDERKRNRRSDEPERFKTQTISPTSMQTTEAAITTGAAEEGQVDLDVLEADARAVIHTLKQEQLSRKNSNSSELLDCETLSLVSNESEPSDRSLNARRTATTSGGCAVRIIRPDDKTIHNPSLQEDDGTVKGIRGRRRVLYPVRVAPTNSAPAPSIVNNRNGSSKATTASRNSRSASPASPSPVRPNRTSALRQNNSSNQQQRAKCPSAPALESQSRLRVSSKSPRVNSAPCSPRQPPVQSLQQQQLNRRSLEMTGTSKITNGNSVVKIAAVDPTHPPLASIGKQGTFTKETSVSPSSAAAAGGPNVESDDFEQFDAMKVPPKVPPKPKPCTAPKPVLPKKPARFPNGGTNHNGGPSPLSSPRSSNKSAGSPALSRRSVSSASIGSDSTSVATAYSSASADEPLKRTPPKKVVASKIASLWKQVEESRSKQKTAEQQPDGRKWIATKAATTVVPSSSSQTTTATPPRPIVSSSTFEKLSSFTDGPPVPFPTSETKRSPPSRLPFRLPRFGRNGSSSSNSPVTTPTLPTPPSPSGPQLQQPTSAAATAIDATSDSEDKRKFRVTAL